MSYAQGDLIEATDYNNLIGANTSTNSATLHAVWAWGANSRGYGQTPISNVTVAGTVTATQWATLVNTVNSANLHIRNTSSGLTANTAGQIIGHSGGLPTAINRLNQDRMLFATNSAVIANQDSLTAYGAWSVASTSSTVTRGFGANVAFGSPDRARFFFNAGGRIKFNVSAVNNAGANSRSAAVVSMFGFLGGIALFGANTNSGRTGTGGTLVTNNTNVGYYNLFGSASGGQSVANVTVVDVTGTTTNYTSDKGYLMVRTNGANQGQFNDNGSILSFWANITSTSGANSGGSFDDSINITPTVTIDVSYPEVTNISNTWGAVTVTRQGS
jgi:hypothetical protein